TPAPAASAAAAFSSTMSRTGPGAPERTDRTTPALNAASPPRRSSSPAGPRPSIAGSNTVEATSPPCTTQTVDGPVVVSSSSPSSPRNTRAEQPRSASTPAITEAIRGSATPTASAEGRAGFVSGPRLLNTVGTPSWLRVGPACRTAGWYIAANRNAIPSDDASSAEAAGGRSITTPSASSTSAAPQADDAARFPCLTIRAPAAAATIVAIVDTLTVRAPSPPVPTRSTTCPGTWIGVACDSIALARPDSSATDAPFIRSAIAKPAICADVAAPSMISPMAHSVSSAVSDSPRVRAPRRAGQVVLISIEGPSQRGVSQRRRPAPASGQRGSLPEKPGQWGG